MRKRFNQLTRDELLKLSPEDIEFYERYELADKGVMLPPSPGEEPVIPVFPSPTIKVYKCRGILTENAEEAKLISKLTSVCYEDYDYNVGSSYRYKKEKESNSHEQASIEEKLIYEKKELNKFSGELKKAKKIHSDWKSDYSEYNGAVKSSREITNCISNTIYAVEREASYLEAAKSKYQEFLELAGNDQTIALNFFSKAYAQEDTEYKLAEFFDGEDLYIDAKTYEEFLDTVGVKRGKQEEVK